MTNDQTLGAWDLVIGYWFDLRGDNLYNHLEYLI